MADECRCPVASLGTAPEPRAPRRTSRPQCACRARSPRSPMGFADWGSNPHSSHGWLETPSLPRGFARRSECWHLQSGSSGATPAPSAATSAAEMQRRNPRRPPPTAPPAAAPNPPGSFRRSQLPARARPAPSRQATGRWAIGRRQRPETRCAPAQRPRAPSYSSTLFSTSRPSRRSAASSSRLDPSERRPASRRLSVFATCRRPWPCCGVWAAGPRALRRRATPSA